MGLIPGRASNGICYYGYGGKEHVSLKFKYLIRNCKLKKESVIKSNYSNTNGNKNNI